MTQKYTFTAVIQNTGGGGAYVEIPFDVEEAFGSKRPKVKALIEGIPYRGTLMGMRTQSHILGIRKETREQIGKSFGEEVEVTVQEDTEPRAVDIPADLMHALVFPFVDPNGSMFQHLQAILPDLKEHFDRAFVTIPKITRERQPENIRLLERDDFFRIYSINAESPGGDHFSFLYRHAAAAAHSEQILHLCFPDRLAFALCTGHRERFLADVDALTKEHLPLIFQRSESAWATHPKNYFELESFVTRVGQTLFGKTLDYGWCHLVIQAGQLREIMPLIKKHDMSMVAEMVLHLQPDVKTREVDWLAWEDPFILGREASELKQELENSLAETQKRLAYVLPMVEMLAKFAADGKA